MNIREEWTVRLDSAVPDMTGNFQFTFHQNQTRICKVFAPDTLTAWARFESALLRGHTPPFNLGFNYVALDWSVIEAQREAQEKERQRRDELAAWRAAWELSKLPEFVKALGDFCTAHGVLISSGTENYTIEFEPVEEGSEIVYTKDEFDDDYLGQVLKNV